MKYYIFSEIYLLLMINNTTHTETQFKPCPICGHELSMKNVYVIDDDEGITEEYESYTDYHVSVDDILDVAVICPCGYSFRFKKDFNYEDDRWLEEFIADANMRSYTDLTDDENILESCQDLMEKYNQITMRDILMQGYFDICEDMRDTDGEGCRIKFYANPEEFDEFYDLYKLWDEHCRDKTLGAMMIEGLKSYMDKMGVDYNGLRHNQNNSSNVNDEKRAE